jgi:hypothetical protein
LVYLTPKGREIHKLRPVVQKVNAIAVRDIDPADITIVRQTLRKMLENLEDAMGDQPRKRATSQKAAKRKMRNRAA